MQTPTQGRSPRFRVAKPLKGFAPLLFRECRRLSSCKRRMCPLGFGRDITPTLLSHAWRIRSVLCRTKSAIFQGRPQCPLLVGLCLQSRLHHALPFLRNAHVMRNTANLWRSRCDLNPRTCSTSSGFQNRPLKPLGYYSM